MGYKKVGMLSNVLSAHVFCSWGEECSSDTCAAGAATLSTKVLALVIRFLCEAAAQAWSHVAFVSKHIEK